MMFLLCWSSLMAHFKVVGRGRVRKRVVNQPGAIGPGRCRSIKALQAVGGGM